MGLHGFDGALRCALHLTVVAHDPVFADLQIHHIAFFEIDDLIRDASKRHRIRCKKIFSIFLTHTENQRRACARACQAMRLIFVKNG